jgi:hypothetical protein
MATSSVKPIRISCDPCASSRLRSTAVVADRKRPAQKDERLCGDIRCPIVNYTKRGETAERGGNERPSAPYPDWIQHRCSRR